MKNTGTADDFCAEQIDVITKFAAIMNVVIKRVHCILLFLIRETIFLTSCLLSWTMKA